MAGMIEREITTRLVSLFRQYPFVTVTGPRQSGKTTLCRAVFPDLAYANLEAPDQRDFAETDPRGFLAQLGDGAIIDEVQHVPALLSYLQVVADECGRNGLFVLTGSEQFRLSDAIGQSLAGRTALLRLLPFSLSERQRIGASAANDEIIYSGFYPRVLDQRLEPRQALGDYFETYVERDVRRLGGVRNLSSFRRFVRLCAGRVGQLVNLSSLGSDAGVSHTTAREWLTLLETSYIAFQQPPFHANIGKRLTKSPKLYFYDVGLASYLLGIEHAKQVATHPLRGSLFENVVVAEAIKHRFNRGRRTNFSFFRDARGLECDLFYETGIGISAIEIKSGSTVSSDCFASLDRVANLIPNVSSKVVVYGGTVRQVRSDCEVVPLSDLSGFLERIDVDQDLAAFVDERKGPVSAGFDVRTLDTIYHTHLRPTLDGLESICRHVADALFRTFSLYSYVGVTGYRTSSPVRLERGNWERTRDEYILTQGLTLANNHAIELTQEFNFGGYAGRGSNDFDMGLVVRWRLGDEAFSRDVMIGGTPIPPLDSSMPYSTLDTRKPDVDRVVAEVAKGLMRRIADWSAGSPA